MKFGVRMTGEDTVLAMLERLRAGTMVLAAEDGVREGLEAVCAEAKTLCPRRTGRLRDSIAVRMGAGGGEVYADAPYAADVELGRGNQPAQPFLYPAMRAREEEVLQRVRRAVSKGVMGKA